MKFAILTVLAASLAGISAQAADLTPPPAPVEPEAITPVFTWSGPYIGAEGGYSWTTFDPDGASNVDANGGILGGFAGYNYQFDNNWVIGVEGDVLHNWNEEDTAFGSVETTWQGSVRARVGYAFDNALLYGTAGWAIARAEGHPTGASDVSDTLNGWTIGAGIDYAFTQNIFARGEYRYTDYGSGNFGGAAGGDFDLNQNTIMIGVGVKF
ncbi:outer membrane protein [Rhizobium sp. BE258]|jgi:outer membrane immunogenic protein|uniref:outer membrane protein n=1 Tax=unclassified Rhizobium TaxID=2613769 RepID=UPI000DDAF83D|nr:outer membrane protein [Rhizobium sp. BE258]MDR7142497.1 outer membrane immunogenic protein [Rhizobium sp. BE258]